MACSSLLYTYQIHVRSIAGMHNPQLVARGAGTGPEEVISGPRSRLKCRKVLLIDGDFMNELVIQRIVNNFATYYNQKQL